MSSLRPHLRSPTSATGWNPRWAAAAEGAAWVALVALLEWLGRSTDLGDVFDLAVVVLGLAPLALLVAAGLRRRWLPLTARAFAHGSRSARRLARRLDPQYHLALRLPAGTATHPESPLRGPLLLLASATAGALLLGPRLWAGLDLLRGLLYTPYLLVLLALWTLALLVATAALVLEAQSARPRTVLMLWCLGLLASAMLPAVALLAALLLLGFGQAVRLARRPLVPYLFCRRDDRDRVRAVPAQVYLRRMHALAVLATALVVALVNADRLFEPGLAHGRHGFTGGLGLIAAMAGLLLVTHIDLQFGRLLSVRGTPPETPLTPTLAWQGPGPVPPDVAEAAGEGWKVLDAPLPEEDEVDLFVGPWATGPAVLARCPERTRNERSFLRTRRFHVVHRRDVFRRLKSLVKETRTQRLRGGTGFLFCPHVWLVPSLLRDGRRGARPVGRPYSAVFSSRSRRYLGGFLRDLGVDVLYWEDAVTWPDLRRVLGVALECWDQRRVPILERHFVGLPRVRVVLHEESQEPGVASARRPRGVRGPVATGARILVVLRDRGGDAVRDAVASPSDRRPAPIGG